MENLEDQIESLSSKFKGEIVISINDDTWDKIDSEFRNAMVLRLSNGKSFNITGFANLFKKVWNVEEGISFQEIKNGMVIVKFNEEKHHNRILETGPWTFAGTLILMKKWEKGINVDHLCIDKLRVWVQIHNLPAGLLLEDRAADFAKVAGTIRKKSQQSPEIVKTQYARYQIELDVFEPIKKGCYLRTREGEYIWMEFKYEKLPPTCPDCNSINHENNICKGNGSAAIETQLPKSLEQPKEIIGINTGRNLSPQSPESEKVRQNGKLRSAVTDQRKMIPQQAHLLVKDWMNTSHSNLFEINVEQIQEATVEINSKTDENTVTNGNITDRDQTHRFWNFNDEWIKNKKRKGKNKLYENNHALNMTTSMELGSRYHPYKKGRGIESNNTVHIKSIQINEPEAEAEDQPYLGQ